MRYAFRRIVALRREMGLSQGAFADAISLSQATLSNYEHGRREIRTETLLTIAKFFDVNIEYLIGETDYRPSVRSLSDVFLETDNGTIANGAFYEKVAKLSLENRVIINQLVDLMITSVRFGQ